MLGDILEDQPIDFYWSTSYKGEPATIAGTPIVSVYKGDSATQHTSTFTPTIDFDGLTGVHRVRITTTDAFFIPGETYHAVTTGGTLGGKAYTRVLFSFTIENRKVILANKLHGGSLATLELFSVYIHSTVDIVGSLTLGSDLVVLGDVIYLGTTTFSQEIVANAANNNITGIDVAKIDGSATAASRAAEFWGAVERVVVDTTGFAGDASSFQVDSTVDDALAWLGQSLYCVNTGETVFVLSYSFSTKVRLGVSTMSGAPANGTVFLKMGRKL